MQDIATAQISGNLAQDVDLRDLPSGAQLARLRVACTGRRRDGDEWVDKTSYFILHRRRFGGQARPCRQYLSRGSRVFVEGELDHQQWTDPQSGARREAVVLRARRVLFESNRNTTPSAPPATPAAQPAGRPTHTGAGRRQQQRGGRRDRGRHPGLMPAKPTVPRFSLGQIWQPERGHPGPTIRLVIIHRPDRLIEAIDTFAPDRLTAKRTIIRFRDLRQHHRLQEADDAERTGRKASDA